MTVSSEVGRNGPYPCNGATVEFSYGFRITNEAHIQVILADASGPFVILTLGADYTVSGVGDDAGGIVTVTPAPPAGKSIVLLRNVPFTQETDLENQGAYYAQVVEDAFDLSTMRAQQLKERLDRAVVIPPSASTEEIDALIGYILALSGSTGPIAAVAAVAADIPAVAGVADIIPQVPALAQKAVDKAAEATQRANDASGSATLAAAYATNPEDVAVPGSGGLFSAFHWYRKTLALYSSVAAGIVGIIHGSSEKVDLVDGDEFAIADSSGAWGLKKVLASTIARYIASSRDDYFEGWEQVWSSSTAFTVRPGKGWFGGKPMTTAADVACSLAANFGSGTGCLDTGVRQASKTYFIYAIRKLSDGSTAFLASLSTSEAGVTIPAGYECLSGSRIGILCTNSGNSVLPFRQTGSRYTFSQFLWFSVTGNANSLAIPPNIPIGISVAVLGQIDAICQAGSSDVAGYLMDVDSFAINTAGGSISPGIVVRARTGNDYPDTADGGGWVRTNSNGQIYRYSSVVGTGTINFYVGAYEDYQSRRKWMTRT